MTRRFRTLMTLVAVLAVVTAACGGDDGEVSATTTTSAATTTTTTTAPTTVAPTTTTTTTAPQTTTTEAMTANQVVFEASSWPTLEGGALYEGWLIIDDAPVSTGAFNVMDGQIVGVDGGQLEHFETEADVEQATAVVITIEPAGDTDPAPADTHFLAGDVIEGDADLTISHPAALGVDFSDAFGEYVLATPTDGDRVNDEFSGVWFLTFPGPAAGLTLPELPAGWIYEGWTIIEGIPVTSGTFLDVAASDNEAPYSGTVRTPNFPGEDYLFNAPSGLTFPTNLSGSTVVVSVEPLSEDNPAPFAIKPLAGPVPIDAELEPVAYPITTDGFEPPDGAATLIASG